MMAGTERSAPEKIELDVEYSGGPKANKEHSWSWLLYRKRGLFQKGTGKSESKHAVLLPRADRTLLRKLSATVVTIAIPSQKKTATAGFGNCEKVAMKTTI
jgi:hypothetical protein